MSNEPLPTRKKALSALNTSSLWLPDRVVPLLPAMQIEHQKNTELNEMHLQVPGQSKDITDYSRFYLIHRCNCSITQSVLDDAVPTDIQEARRRAESNHETLPKLQFQCPSCHSSCTDYRYDPDEVRKYRARFTRGRYIYILIDKSSSMATRFAKEDSSTVRSGEIKLSHFDQTKVTVRELLKQIASSAGPMDKIELNTFDKELTEPALIQECDARSANSSEHLERLDSIKLSGILVRTHFYGALKSVYQLLQRQAFHEIRLQVFSNGEDTSGNTEDIKHFREVVKSLHERLGVNCAFVQCGTSSANIHYSNFNWPVNRADISAMSGSESMILEQSARHFKQYYPMQIDTRADVSRASNEDFDEHDNAHRICRTFKATPANEVASSSINTFPEPKVLDVPYDFKTVSRSKMSYSTAQPRSYTYAVGVRRRKT